MKQEKLKLYTMDMTAEHVLECVDAYKKKLYVDKVKLKQAEEMLAKAERAKESVGVDYDIKHVDKTIIGLAK